MNDRFSDLRILRWHDRITGILNKAGLGPIRASLDLTNLCNDKCPWCEPAAYREESIRDRRHTLDTSVAIEVLQDLAELHCRTVNFSGGGEPLLHPDFGTILKYAVRNGMRAWVVTNGRYIDKWLEALLKADHVRISLDASNEAQHMEMHGAAPGEFAKTLHNIKTLCDARKATGSKLEVGISYLVADCNFTASPCITEILQFASDTGVDFIHFRPLSEDTPQRYTAAWQYDAKLIQSLGRNFPDVKVFCVDKRSRDVFSQREFKYCYASLITATIGANGDLQACCDERGKTYGNVNEQSFRSLWLAAAHRKMSKEIVPALCQRCLMCSVNRAVEKYVVNNEALPELI